MNEMRMMNDNQHDDDDDVMLNNRVNGDILTIILF